MKEELLKLREKIKKKKPKFKRQEWRRKSLRKVWRKPRGLHSKLRRQEKARGRLPSPGYGSPKAIKGLDKYGYEEVLIHNVKDLEKVDPKRQICVISHSVGRKKRFEIMELANKRDIKVKGQII
jgi:large subunit ribosomal protein L32e